MAKNMSFYILIAAISILCSCRGNIFYWKHVPYYPVANSENNFLKIYLPSEISDSNETLRVESYLVSVLQEEKGTILHRRVLINPDRGIGFNDLWNGLEQFHFRSDCNLIIPISNGKSTYEVKVGKYPDGFQDRIVIDADLSKDQSIILSFFIEDIPYPSPESFSQRISNRLQNRIHLKFAVTQTLDKDSTNDCVIQKKREGSVR